MSDSNWLPRGREALFTLISGVVAYIEVNAVSFCLDKETRLGDWYIYTFLEEYSKYLSSYGKWKNPATRTIIVTDKLKEAEAYRHLPIKPAVSLKLFA